MSVLWTSNKFSTLILHFYWWIFTLILWCFQKQPPEIFCKGKGVLRHFAKFTGKHLCQSLFFNKVAGLRPATLLKKRLWYRCFPVNFAKFLGTPFLQSTSGRLLLCFHSLLWKLGNHWSKCYYTVDFLLFTFNCYNFFTLKYCCNPSTSIFR